MGVAEIKSAVRKRDGYRCTECGMTNEEHKEKTGRSLEVHRLTPGSSYTVEGCTTLCRVCHGPKPKSPCVWGAGKRVLNGSVLFSLPPALYKKLSELAHRNRRPIQWEAIIAIENHLKATPPHLAD